jgi:hypothetical protein
MPRLTAHPLFVLTLALTLSGCDRAGAPTAPAGSADEAEITAALAASPEVQDETAFDSNEEAQMIANSPFAGGTLAAIQPLRFWRRIADVDRRFSFEFSDPDSTGRPTRAVVTVRRTLRGAFIILAGPAADLLDAAHCDTTHLVRKRLLDHGTRRILLVRVSEPARARCSWKVAASSGAVIVSDPRDQAPVIQSVRVETANLDTTITEPLAFWFLRRIPKLEAGGKVRVTVTTAAVDDAVWLLRLGHKVPLVSQGDGTHVGEFTVGDEPGLRHVAVNALAHATLFDDAAPYRSRAWVLPYAVRAEELAAEYRPAD